MRQSSSFTGRRRAKRIWTSLGVIVALVLIVWGISALTRVPFLRIDSIQISGLNQDAVSALQAAIEQKLNGNYLGLFSRRDVLLYPYGTIVALIKSMYPQAATIDVHRGGLRSLIISVTDKTPSAIVCPRLPDLDTPPDQTDPCYFADKSGYVFDKAPVISGDSYDRYYAPNIADPVLGQYATSTSEFVKLVSVYDGAKFAGIPVKAVLISEKGEYEMYALNKKDDIIVINFNNARPMSEELANLISFWNKIASASTTISSIDVRYGSNVFYR